ncbi:Transcription initiation factor TFIID subunit 13 [Phlyctochytrium planicorne]|nr:Transcription initiation factor TFIID subunit 13 [Phlyctochytrium planicorne]
MFGFGDVPNAADDTAEVLEDLLLIYINDLCKKVTTTTKGRKPKLADFLYALRKDPKKLVRVHELLVAEKDLTNAKAIMSLDELPLNKGAEQQGGPGGLALPAPASGPSGPSHTQDGNTTSGIFRFGDQAEEEEE